MSSTNAYKIIYFAGVLQSCPGQNKELSYRLENRPSASCFRRVIMLLALGDNRVKTNEYTPILSATKCSPGTIVSGDIRFMRIFARVLTLGGVN